MSMSACKVIKVGGAALNNADAMTSFWSGVAQLYEEGPIVVVHGGGPQATEVASRLGQVPQIVQGRRVTGDADLEVVLWTLCGAVNTTLVAQAIGRGLPAIGLTGADGSLVEVEKRPPWQVDGKAIDFGWVGDIVGVRLGVLETLMSAGYLPVVASLGIDADGRLFNVNADTTATAIAKALRSASLMMVTNVGRLYASSSEAEAVPRCTPRMFDDGVEDGWIRDGMRVKLTVSFDALRAGVGEVFIVGPDDLLTRSRGTEVVL